MAIQKKTPGGSSTGREAGKAKRPANFPSLSPLAKAISTCIRCGDTSTVVGVFVPAGFKPRFLYALCARCYPPSPQVLRELEERFNADPAMASYIGTGGRA